MRRAILLAAAAVVLLAACSNGEGDSAGASSGSGPPVAGGGLASCVEQFSVDGLAQREFAFDGIVAGIREPDTVDGPYEVDFSVSRWYHGGEGSSVTFTSYDVTGTSLAGDLGLEVGKRVLASGDDEFLWGCGFSMTYSEENAELFGQAFPE